MDLTFDIYIPGENNPPSVDALKEAICKLDVGMSYSEMMRFRASGRAKEECTDVYYLCTDENSALVSRLWMGWGKHQGAVGNWGNFFTSPSCRGQGIGRKMLDIWYDDVQNRTDAPRALFCTAGSEGLVKLYEPYGFRPAIKGATSGPLYCPLGDSPDSFEEFCAEYYKPAKSLVFKRATLEWRHEIDCLFKFAMLDAGLDYLPEGMVSLEASILANGADDVEIIFTDENVPVGLAKLRKDMKKDVRIHPSYMHLI